jgi:hypothetical protein
MGDRPVIKPHGTELSIYTVYQISGGCDKELLGCGINVWFLVHIHYLITILSVSVNAINLYERNHIETLLKYMRILLFNQSLYIRISALKHRKSFFVQ